MLSMLYTPVRRVAYFKLESVLKQFWFTHLRLQAKNLEDHHISYAHNGRFLSIFVWTKCFALDTARNPSFTPSQIGWPSSSDHTRHYYSCIYTYHMSNMPHKHLRSWILVESYWCLHFHSFAIASIHKVYTQLCVSETTYWRPIQRKRPPHHKSNKHIEQTTRKKYSQLSAYALRHRCALYRCIIINSYRLFKTCLIFCHDIKNQIQCVTPNYSTTSCGDIHLRIFANIENTSVSWANARWPSTISISFFAQDTQHEWVRRFVGGSQKNGCVF